MANNKPIDTGGKVPPHLQLYSAAPCRACNGDGGKMMGGPETGGYPRLLCDACLGQGLLYVPMPESDMEIMANAIVERELCRTTVAALREEIERLHRTIQTLR